MVGRDVSVNYVAPFAYTRMTQSIPPVTDQLRRYLEWAPRATPADVAPFVSWLCSPAAAGVSGQVFGVRGAAVNVWSQPRPVVEVCEPRGWDLQTLEAVARPQMEAHLTPLESEFDLFGGPPVEVTSR